MYSFGPRADSMAVLLTIFLALLSVVATEQEPGLFRDSLEKLFGSSHKCSYRQDFDRAVEERLKNTIGGQADAVASIVNAISNWKHEKSLKLTRSGPLVLAFSGPTGTGKTESAVQIAEALFSERWKVDEYGDRSKPCGFLFLAGALFSNFSEIGRGGVVEAQNYLKALIVDHLVQTKGHAVIVLDEVQKVMPGVLDILIPAMEERGSLSSTSYVSSSSMISSTYSWLMSAVSSSTGEVDCFIDSDHPSCAAKGSPSNPNSRSVERVPLRPVVRQYPTTDAIFLFTSDIGHEQLAKLVITHGHRSQIPQKQLRSTIKTALDGALPQLRLGKLVDGAIPFLPMEAEQLEQTMKLRMKQFADEFRSHWWADLFVDEEVYSYLSAAHFIDYEAHSLVLRPKATADGGTSSSSEDRTLTKHFVRYGARAISNGPIQALQNKLRTYAKPYQPNKILHVGLLSERNMERSIAWGNKNFAYQKVYFQWCVVDARMKEAVTRLENCSSQGDMTCQAEKAGKPPRVLSASANAIEEYVMHHRLLRTLQDNPSLITDDIAFNASLCNTLWLDRISV